MPVQICVALDGVESWACAARCGLRSSTSKVRAPSTRSVSTLLTTWATVLSPTTARPKECAHPGARAKLARLGALAQRGAADAQFLAMLRSLDDSHTALEHKWAAMARHVAREADFRCGSLRCLLQRFATQTWTGGKAEGCCCRAHDGTITCRVTGALWRCLLTLCIYTLLCTAFKGVSALLQRIWHMP